MAVEFDPYSFDNRTLTITRDDPWGTHVGYDTKRTGGIIAGPSMSNHRFGEIYRRIGFPLALEAKVEMMTTFTALGKIPVIFGLDGDDALAWRVVDNEIGNVYRHERSYFDRMTRPPGSSIITRAEAAEVHSQMVGRMQAANEATRDAAERVATWIELAGLIQVPEDFSSQQRELFVQSLDDKERMWDYTGVQVW